MVRVPDWWKPKNPPRPVVSVALGAKQPSGLGVAAMLDFSVRVSLGDEELTREELEMLRKGRFDELMFVDLPNEEERTAIWEIQIAKYNRDAAEYDLVALAKATDGLTGSEIEQVFVEALFWGFEQEKEPTDLTIAQVLTEFVPLSKLMAEHISQMRTWAKGRAKQATTQVSFRGTRKIAV